MTQYVIVGAGFDTFALRRPDVRDQVRVFEIDHPTMQNLKRKRLHDAGLDTPINVHYVPADFEVERVADALVRSAYDASSAAFFAWLGVISYLTRPAIEGTFRSIMRIAPRGSEIVFDYLTALAFVPERQSPALKLRFDRARAVGEPYLTGFEPSELSSVLRPLGYDSWRTWANLNRWNASSGTVWTASARSSTGIGPMPVCCDTSRMITMLRLFQPRARPDCGAEGRVDDVERPQQGEATNLVTHDAVGEVNHVWERSLAYNA